MAQTYEAALKLLTRLHPNTHIVDLFNRRPPNNEKSLPEMLQFLNATGHTQTDLSALKCIHISGTKGKGSTTMYASSILAHAPPELRERASKTQLSRGIGPVAAFTSPHLSTPRERISLDNKPISKPLFTKSFFEIWDKLESASETSARPFYFRFMLLLALHTFLREGIQDVVMECGIGGEFDSTNILPPEAISCSVVTSLGIDHVSMLGNTREEIAWHKAGIFKSGKPAFTRRLDEGYLSGVRKVLHDRAREKNAHLVEIPDSVADSWDVIPNALLTGPVQKYNRVLAVAATLSHLNLFTDIESCRKENVPSWVIEGIRAARLRGRCEVLLDTKGSKSTWFVDGAHTIESLAQTTEWFSSVQHKYQPQSTSPINNLNNEDQRPLLLIFNQQTRDTAPLLSHLLTTLASAPNHIPQFQHAIFPLNFPNPRSAGEEPRDTTVQEQTASLMRELSPGTRVEVYESTSEAVDAVRRIEEREGGLRVLATGSLHLVGGLVSALEKDT